MLRSAPRARLQARAALVRRNSSPASNAKPIIAHAVGFAKGSTLPTSLSLLRVNQGPQLFVFYFEDIEQSQRAQRGEQLYDVAFGHLALF
jgi:hypothetical protein